MGTQPNPESGQRWRCGSRVVTVLGLGPTRHGVDGVRFQPERGHISTVSLRSFLSTFEYVGPVPKKAT
jgi:hypothetical protein